MKKQVPQPHWHSLDARGKFLTDSGPGSAITVRGVVVGTLMPVVFGVGAPYTTVGPQRER